MPQTTEEQETEAIKEAVYFILIADQKKLPIKRADIIKNSCPEQPHNVQKRVIEGAGQCLKKVFGMTLHQLQTKVPQYIVSRAIESEDVDCFEDDKKPITTLLAIVLAVIFMQKENMTEEQLIACLSKFGIEYDAAGNGFESGKAIIQSWLKQMYLETSVISSTDPVKYEYVWGQRANLEFSKRGILKFVSEVYGNNIKDWSKQYKTMLNAEGMEADQGHDDSQLSTA